MPRTSHDVPVHDPLAQRPAPMQAGIVDGIELAAHIGQGNGFALHLKLANRSRRDFIRLCSSRKRHLFITLLRYRLCAAPIQTLTLGGPAMQYDILFLYI